VVCLEDDFDLARLIQLTLRQWPVTVHIAHDGLHGLQLIHTHRPDLILLDLGLPGLSGWEVFADLQQDPALKSIPVVVLTAVPPENHDGERSALRQVAAYVLKPFTPSSLRAILQPFFPPSDQPSPVSRPLSAFND
jgi:two-component system CheB/CheR fusion protein